MPYISEEELNEKYVSSNKLKEMQKTLNNTYTIIQLTTFSILGFIYGIIGLKNNFQFEFNIFQIILLIISILALYCFSHLLTVIFIGLCDYVDQFCSEKTKQFLNSLLFKTFLHILLIFLIYLFIF